MKFNAGFFFSLGRYESYTAPPSALAFTTIEDKPRLVSIEYLPDNGDPPHELTDPNGVGWYGVGGIQYNDIKLSQNAVFFGHHWDITPKLNLDWGCRYESFSIDNSFITPDASLTSPDGGVDKNPLTLYDSIVVTLKPLKRFRKSLRTFSISGGLNFKVSNSLAYYIRYSLGNKLPDVSNYIANQQAASVVKEKAQQTIQLEAGIKYEGRNTNFTATPFLCVLKNVPRIGFANDSGSLSSYYSTPTLYNKVHTVGIELEGNFNLSSHFSFRCNAVVQQFYSDKYMFYDLRGTGQFDDTIIDRSGKRISDQAAPVMINLTSSYKRQKWYADVNMNYVSKRAANTSETFYLPAFSQFDFHVSYAFTDKIKLQATVNNFFNHFAVIEWTAPISSGFPFETFETQQFSPEKRQSNPNANYFTMAIQPRSFFLDLVIKL